jgi:hypothetical protein
VCLNIPHSDDHLTLFFTPEIYFIAVLSTVMVPLLRLIEDMVEFADKSNTIDDWMFHNIVDK